MNKSIIFAILVVFLCSNVIAIGITPGRTTLDYSPNEIKEVSFSIVNSESKDMDLVVLVSGELNESISVSEVSFKMSASESEKTLTYKVDMPQKLSPGTHIAEITVLQLPDKSPTGNAFVGAAVGVTTQLYVNVPYPGKYAEAELNVIGYDSPGKVTFVMPVMNLGDLDLTRVRATIDIYGALNEKVTTLNTNEISLSSQKRAEVYSEWNAEVQPGIYRAVATLIYDEQTVTIEKQFSVGEAVLDVQQIEVNDFSLGQIAKFEMLVENKWSEPIVGAYAEMLVYNNLGEVMADFKSATYDLSPFEKTLMVAFWDTDGVRAGNYDSSIFLRYGEHSVQKDLKLEVSQSNINVIGLGYVISKGGSSGSLFGGSSTMVILLGTAVGVLVLINLIWFLVLRKYLKKRK